MKNRKETIAKTILTQNMIHRSFVLSFRENFSLFFQEILILTDGIFGYGLKFAVITSNFNAFFLYFIVYNGVFNLFSRKSSREVFNQSCRMFLR